MVLRSFIRYHFDCMYKLVVKPIKRSLKINSLEVKFRYIKCERLHSYHTSFYGFKPQPDRIKSNKYIAHPNC